MSSKFFISRLAIAAVASCFCIEMSAADEHVFSYAGDGGYSLFGTKKAEHYDVAIALDGTLMKSKSVKSILVPVVPQAYSEAGEAALSNLNIWIAPDLEAFRSDTGVTRYDAEFPATAEAGMDFAWVTLALPEAYRIPESGLFIGYSFDVDSPAGEAATLIVVQEGSHSGALWLHSSRTYKKWDDRSAVLDKLSGIKVILGGNFPEAGINIDAIDNYRAFKGECGVVNVHISNEGVTAVTSFDYTTRLGDNEFKASYDFGDMPLAPLYGLEQVVGLEVPEATGPGTFDLVVTIDRINGMANEASRPSITGIASVPYFIPANRPLVEEFTGTGCGYCPRGFVAYEKMSEMYPDDFIGVAWHAYNTSDPMFPATGYPQIYSGAPSCTFNRGDEVDPYYADHNVGFHMPEYWDSFRQAYTPVSVNVKAEWADDTYSHIAVTAEYEWASLPDNPDAEFRLEYILVGDDLHGDGKEWQQTNYYTNGKYGYPDYMEQFTNTDEAKISGLHFNDVGLLSSGIGGIRGSITSIEAGRTFEHTYTIDPSQALNTTGVIDFHKWALKVVCAVVEADGCCGKVVNSARCSVPAPASVGSMPCDSAVVAEYFVDLHGRSVANPENGIFIKVKKYNDGTITTEKISRK